MATSHDDKGRDADPVSSLLARRLEWILPMLESLHRATTKFDLDFKILKDPTDKLKVTLVTRLLEPLEEGSDRITKRIIRSWASINDLEVASIEVGPLGIEVVLLVKYRGGEVCNRTPWDTRRPIKAKHGLGNLTCRRRHPRKSRG